MCAYTALRPETEKALADHVPPGDVVRLLSVAHSETAYAEALAEMWAMQCDWVCCEHDNVLRPDIAKAFHECPEPWCAFPYSWTTNVGPALGMTRFKGSFCAKYPDAVREAMAQPSAWGANGHWRQIGWFVTDWYLRNRGERPHVHLPSCAHLNEKQALQADVAGLSDEEHLRLLGYTEWAA